MRVGTHTCLGTVIDSELKCNENTDSTKENVNSRMYCLRKLKILGICADVLLIFHSAVRTKRESSEFLQKPLFQI